MSSFLVSPFCWAEAICDNATPEARQIARNAAGYLREPLRLVAAPADVSAAALALTVCSRGSGCFEPCSCEFTVISPPDDHYFCLGCETRQFRASNSDGID
jgi:hypothetical protein